MSVCGTGTLGFLSNFSRQCEGCSFPTILRSRSHLRLNRARTSLRSILGASTELTITPLCSSSCVIASVKHPLVVQEFPPVVHRLRPYVLGLGPDLPWADKPSPGNLGLSTARFLTELALLIPAFSLACSPHVLTIMLQPACNVPLPICLNNRFHSFGGRFSPVTSSAQNHSTSELLRTLSMRGCF